MNPHPIKKTASFTLIELLVVIAIIAVLAGIALPVYQGVIERGRATQDASNLRQLGMSTMAYLNDNGNQMFTSGTSWPLTLSPTYASTGKIFASPLDSGANNAPSVLTTTSPVSYGVNNLLVTATSYNMDKLTYPSTLIVMSAFINTSYPAYPSGVTFGTGSPPNNLEGLAGSSPTLNGPSINASAFVSTSNYGTFSNRGKINALFADWHVQPLSWILYSGSSSSTQWTPQ